MILPTGLSFERWSAEVALNESASLPAATEDNWREWAVAYIEQSGFEAPNPNQFNQWQEWAERLLEIENV